MAIIENHEKVTNANYTENLFSYLQNVSAALSDYFVFIFSGTTYIQEERGNRPIRQTRVLLKQSIPVLFSYWRWRNNEPYPEFPDENLFQSPIDKTLENIQDIIAYDFKGKKKIFIITFPHPSIVDLMDNLNRSGWITIYDVRDDWEEFKKVGQAKWFDSQVEEYIVNHSEIVSAVSKPLQQKIQSIAINKTIYLSPNALDSDFMTDGKINISPRDGKPVIGYVGHLADAWFDWQSLISAANLKPDWAFEIIGHHIPENLTLPSNINYLGPKNHDEIKYISKEWRAAIIPFKIGKLSDGVDPIKIYEYLCLGLPVVSFRMPQIHNYPYVLIANNVTEFINQIERALCLPMDTKVIEDFLSKNRWEDRIRQLFEWSDEVLRKQKAAKLGIISRENSSLKILYLYRYGVLGGVSTQLINRMRYLRNYCEPHFGFIKDYGAISAFRGYPHVHELSSTNEIVEYINMHQFDAIIPIDTNEVYEAIIKSDFKGAVINEVHTTYEKNLRTLQALRQNVQIDAIITPSRYLQNRIAQEFAFERSIPTFVVENFLDTNLFENQTTRGSYDKKIILWVGKLDDHKNWRSFLSIAHTIQQKIENCEFWLVGGYTAADKVTEALRAEIRDLGLSDCIRWIPRVAYGSMPKVYSSAANSGGCFISTSQNESFGMAIIEALACNCPCIVPNVGAIPEIMDGRLSDCLYTSNNEDEAVEKTIYVMENTKVRFSLIQSGRKKVLDNYNLDTAGKKYADTLVNVINQRRFNYNNFAEEQKEAEDFRLISVTTLEPGKLIVNNPTSYPLISKGWHGAVFKLSDNQCVKIFAEERIAAAEIAAYNKMKDSPLIPLLYETGPNYIVMEYIKGLTVLKYLMHEKDISESIARQFLSILEELRRLKLTMIDFELDNAIMTENDHIKLIDLASSFRINSTKPLYLLKGLHKLDLLHKFMEEIKKIDCVTYQDFKKIIYEEIGISDLD